MCSSRQNLLEGQIELDEFFVCGPEEGKIGQGE